MKCKLNTKILTRYRIAHKNQTVNWHRYDNIVFDCDAYSKEPFRCLLVLFEGEWQPFYLGFVKLKRKSGHWCVPKNIKAF